MSEERILEDADGDWFKDGVPLDMRTGLKLESL
jgi:hypothetical protein